ncbi:FecR/PupR family sigma factor regulator, partial [Achromobacter insolitus]|uniref:FecR/PupR family sigma factor regulator n=1 Tax=Achromobacter insolitus TaxID=217204 RepID=UPI0027DEFF1A
MGLPSRSLPADSGAAPSSGSALKADFDSLQQAADWFALLRADGVTDQDRTAWQAWLRERAEHATAWRHIEAVSQQ